MQMWCEKSAMFGVGKQHYECKTLKSVNASVVLLCLRFVAFRENVHNKPDILWRVHKDIDEDSLFKKQEEKVRTLRLVHTKDPSTSVKVV